MSCGLLTGLRAWREDHRGKSSDRGRRAASAASTVLLVLAAAFLVFVLLQVQAYGYVRLFGYSLFRVVTGSMEPAIPTGALLVSRETDIRDVAPVDIVCFRSMDPGTNGWIITHRVTAVHTDGLGGLLLETKGDANAATDARFASEANLIGKVVWYTGEGDPLARAIGFLTSGAGFMMLILVPCLLIAGVLLSRSVRTIRREVLAMGEEADRLKEDNKLSAEAAQYGLTAEEYTQLYHEVMQELLAMKDEILAMVRQELMKEMQGDRNDDAPTQKGP